MRKQKKNEKRGREIWELSYYQTPRPSARLSTDFCPTTNHRRTSARPPAIVVLLPCTSHHRSSIWPPTVDEFMPNRRWTFALPLSDFCSTIIIVNSWIIKWRSNFTRCSTHFSDYCNLTFLNFKNGSISVTIQIIVELFRLAVYPWFFPFVPVYTWKLWCF